MGYFASLLRRMTRRDSPKADWRTDTDNPLYILDEQAFPAQPHSLPLPNEILREASSIGDLGSFYAIGEAWGHLVSKFLPENPAVLDLGCGCGKLARFLYINPKVKYTGIDIYAPAIKWCQRAFSSASDRFQFIHSDGQSDVYNPTGKIASTEHGLPLPDEAIDMTVCASLFTHLYEDAAKHYLSEIFRVTKPGGQAIISIHVEPEVGKLFSGDEGRIDIAPEYFEQLCKAAQMPVEERIGVVYGQTVFRLMKH